MNFKYLSPFRASSLFRAVCIICTFLNVFVSTGSHAQTWKPVGVADFTPNGLQYLKLAVNKSGTPYVVFTDTGHAQKATVMKFDGVSWVTVGAPGITPGAASYTSIAFDTSDVPYIAFVDGTNAFRATVLKYDGASWVTVGSGVASSGYSPFLSLTINKKENAPYITFEDCGSKLFGPIAVMKYDGTNWITVGPAGFPTGNAGHMSLAFDKGGTPYVTYLNDVLQAIVQKYNGTAWVDIASGDLTRVADYQTLTIDDTGAMYLSFEDDASAHYGLSVMKFNGAHWMNVGASGISAGEVYFPCMSIDPLGAPVVFYNDGAYGKDAVVKRFNGSNWEVVGDSCFSSGAADYGSIAIDKSGRIYVAYQENTASFMGSVFSLSPGDQNTTGIKKPADKNGVGFSVFPNPAQGVVQAILTAPAEESYTVTVTNMLGVQIHTYSLQTNRKNDLHIETPGVYVISASSLYGVQSETVVVR